MKPLYFLFAILISIIKPGSCQQVSGTINKNDSVTLDTGSGKLYGTLFSPSDGKASVLVLLIAGSGPTDRDGNNPMMKNNSLKMIAEGLSERGIASFSFDKRAVGASALAATSENELRLKPMWPMQLAGYYILRKIMLIKRL